MALVYLVLVGCSSWLRSRIESSISLASGSSSLSGAGVSVSTDVFACFALLSVNTDLRWFHYTFVREAQAAQASTGPPEAEAQGSFPFAIFSTTIIYVIDM